MLPCCGRHSSIRLRERSQGFGEFYRHRLDAAGAEAVDSILPLFVNELAGTSRPIRIFLDDLHHLTGERSIESLQRLLHHLPPHNSLVVASREAAPFPIGRLRMERAVEEIGAADLAMDVGVARAAVSAAGIEPDDDQIAALLARTEGWVAGLAWATLAMQARTDTRSFVETVGALDGELTSYLVEEVLDQRSPEMRAFMLDTSILTHFNAPLCDEMRGLPMIFNIESDPREMRNIAQENSWVIRPYLQNVGTYMASLQKHPNPPPANITVF